MVGYPDETLQYTSHATQQTQDTNLNFAEIQVSQDDHIATSPSDDNQGGTSEAVPSYETVHTTATNDSNSSDIIFPPENLNQLSQLVVFLNFFLEETIVFLRTSEISASKRYSLLTFCWITP